MTTDQTPSPAGSAPGVRPRGRRAWISADHPRYKWVALTNTTLGVLIATVNGSIVLISLPGIFTSLRLDPLQPGNVSYLLWRRPGTAGAGVARAVDAGPQSGLVELGEVGTHRLAVASFGGSALQPSLNVPRVTFVT
ncbi:hypothetical protein O1M07_03650 [Streptomyces albulus]|nr:hypothetical protein [Streptomyces noursei]MCZ1013355.1 hypothetical protein [Streptomyces noursei]GGX47529.1 hypothetical protein GCM10010341_81520 [Streptomyces noursei]